MDNVTPFLKGKEKVMDNFLKALGKSELALAMGISEDGTILLYSTEDMKPSDYASCASLLSRAASSIIMESRNVKKLPEGFKED